ncbi:hypothetical protein M0R45_038193 [Rubus argutus]|uniref:Reverse transcriptase domain-containing protein n=1 Tax=Rubus argutus TaxID=59490 RepID=A0AAW1W4J0_RUBAR
MNADTMTSVKEEVEKMHKSGIIRVAKYNEWLSNIVPVRKKNGKMRVCVDYRDLNNATSKGCVSNAGGGSFSRCGCKARDAVLHGWYCWLSPDSSRRRRIGIKRLSGALVLLKVYIDDVVVKSKVQGDHLADLRKVFERMRLHKLKMNPAKCVFGVQAGDFLGFLVHQRGIEVPGDKAKAVIDAPAPRTKKELQSLLGKINFLRRFISNSAGKIAPFSPLLKLQGAKEFVWEPVHQEAFDRIKEYLANPPVLVPPKPGVPLKLYISASDASIAGLLAQDERGPDGKTVEHAIST